MNTLYPLIQSLTPAEIKGIQSELKQHRSESKSLKLFKTLLETATIEEAEGAVVKLYDSGGNRRNFKKLIRRLEDKILEYLISDKNIAVLSKRLYLDSIKLKKKYCQVLYLNFNKAKQQSLISRLLDEIISTAKGYENYPDLIAALSFQKNFDGLRQGLDEFEKAKAIYWHYVECFYGTRMALELYYELSIRKSFNDPSSSLDIFLLKSIRHLTEIYDRTGATTVNYYLKFFQIEYEEGKGNYKKAIELGLEKLEIIRAHKAVFEKNRIGIAYDDIAACYIMLRQYPEAIKYLKEARKYFIKDGYNYCTSIRIECETLFYSKKYQEALRGFSELQQLIQAKSYSFFFDKIVCNSCYCLFAQKRYYETLTELSRPLETSTDKTGWDIAMRVLMIMSLIELQRLDEASHHVERLRKHVSRYGKTSYITPRNITIVKLLQALDSNGFIFDLHHPRMSQLLNDLKDPALAWKPLTPELLPFEEWFTSHRQE